MPQQLDPLAEQFIGEACAAGEFGVAVTRAFEAYGAEILGFLVARLHTRSDGEEAFSIFAEDLCQALSQFEFRCSVRGFMYVLARNAGHRYLHQRHKRAEQRLSNGLRESITALINHERTSTEAHRRTEVKHQVRRLRESLPDEDQLLLILYIDRGLPWTEIAMIMDDGETPLDADGLLRESARLRKRFERVKAVLREWAKRDGLIDP